MILGDGNRTGTGGVTLDDLFRAALARHPDAVALIDPPDKPDRAGGDPRRFTYAEADRVVSAIADRLGRLGLKADTVVAIQLPNTAESVLALLGVLRAGMIAALVPLLWRKADMVAALGPVGPKILITAARIGETADCELAMQTAAELFAIRYVCAFGDKLPDGIVPLDDLFIPGETSSPPEIESREAAAAHVAIVTWETGADGFVPVARSHGELVAAGLPVFLEGRMKPGCKILSATPIGSLAGLASSVLPWLLGGGTLVLHQPFDADVFARQLEAEACDTLVLPGPLASTFAVAAKTLRTVVALWRAPERLAGAAAFREPIDVVDVCVFGEAGLFAARRGMDGKPAAIHLGVARASDGAGHSAPMIELSRSKFGSVTLRGPMVPGFAFPSATDLKRTDDGFVDTGYPGKTMREPDRQTLIVTAAPPGLVGVGGYRFAGRDIDQWAGALETGAAIAALPHALTGRRLAGTGADPAAANAGLHERGANPLIAGAFRPNAPDAA